MKKLKRFFKRMYIAFIRARCESAQFEVANIIAHKYPAGTSLHDIVKDMKKQRKV